MPGGGTVPLHDTTFTCEKEIFNPIYNKCDRMILW